MGFCIKCGAKMPDDAMFCAKCGAKLLVDSLDQKETERPDAFEDIPENKEAIDEVADLNEDGEEQVPEEELRSESNDTSSSSIESEKPESENHNASASRNKTKLIGIVAVAILAIIVIIILSNKGVPIKREHDAKEDKIKFLDIDWLTEKKEVEKKVKNYFAESSDKLKDKIGITKKRLYEVFEKDAIASKVEDIMEAEEKGKAGKYYKDFIDDASVDCEKCWSLINFNQHIFSKKDVENETGLATEVPDETEEDVVLESAE